MPNDYNLLLKYSDKLLHILLILVLAWAAYLLTKRAIRIMKAYWGNQAEGKPEELKRIETLGQVFRHTFSIIIFAITGMLLLDEIGISIGPILATAGVVGVAIGFGAQNLIRDYFNGFFILLENQVRQGDVVVVAEKGGLVEEITLRYMKLRDYSGNVHFIPHGNISTVTNMSRGFAYAVIDIGVAYREDLDEVMNIMRQVGAEIAEDPLFSGKVLAEMEMAGVDKWGESAVIIRCRIKVHPLEQWGIRREFLKRLKQKFDHFGIEIPYPHLTVYPGQSKDGTAPPLNIASQTISNK
jgi:moderate conductance mechanosensitive channel